MATDSTRCGEGDGALPRDLEDALAEIVWGDHRDRALRFEGLAARNPAHADRLRDRFRELCRIQEEPVSSADASDAASGGPWSPGPMVIGPFRTIRVLGRGASGTVFLAEQSEPVHRVVAVKLLADPDPRAVARFHQEFEALASMTHEFIARVLEYGTLDSDGRPWIALEHVENGVPLAAYVREKRLSLQAKIALFQDVCRGAHHAHQRGFLHRDLKPANVLVAERDGRAVPKIIDFGLAKLTDGAARARLAGTREGAFLGTPSYMSPEQARGERDIAVTADVYSLGAVLHELLAGLPPLDRWLAGRDPAAQMAAICEQEPPPPSEVSRVDRVRLRGDLDRIVAKALSKDRRLRYQSAADLADDLQRFREHRPIAAHRPSFVYRSRKFLRRNRVAALVLGVLLAASTSAAVQAVGAAREAEKRAWVEEFLARAARVLEKHLSKPELAAVLAELEAQDMWRWWRCVYADGSVVYNRFRFYRGLADATVYFHGLALEPDCDAFEIVGNERRAVCYSTTAAQELERKHGSIVRIERIEQEPK
ncbi:MAG TPA: serine/threonine-protein kinase [Planctomycetota bacterium]|nr:serine/threonine-protein kinase [Planctomycetota bacterium]